VPRETEKGVIHYLGGSLRRKAGERPYRGIGLNRRKTGYDNCLDAWVPSDETGAWAESLLMVKKTNRPVCVGQAVFKPITQYIF